MTKHMTHMLLRGLRVTTNAAAFLGSGESLDDGEEEVKYPILMTTMLLFLTTGTAHACQACSRETGFGCWDEETGKIKSEVRFTKTPTRSTVQDQTPAHHRCR
jgi:hypothetical protein